MLVQSVEMLTDSDLSLDEVIHATGFIQREETRVDSVRDDPLMAKDSYSLLDMCMTLAKEFEELQPHDFRSRRILIEGFDLKS